MATAVIMPRQGQSVESCLIGKWYKSKGDKVSVGDVLFTYETDKATFEEESKVDGVMLDVFFEEGDDVECLVNVCVIGADGESVDEFRPAVGGDVGGVSAAIGTSASQGDRRDGSFGSVDSSAAGTNQTCQKNRPPDTFGSAAAISPRARRLAERTYADLRYAVPTGAGGRVIERDVQAVLAQGHRSAEFSGTAALGAVGGAEVLGAAGGTGAGGAAKVQIDYAAQYGDKAEVVALSNVRKFIAKAMHASLANSAQLTSHSSFDATDVFAYRKKLKESASAKPVPTITDIIIFAVSRVLLKHKYINSHFLGEKMALFNNAHIGVAVDTPRGLLVPTIFNADSMSLSDLSAHAKGLFEKCKQGSIEPDLLQGASFTISNLGSLGVEMFTPILNPPQTGILGVCNVIERLKNGKPYPALGLSITYDHQAMDGADSARFLKDLVEYLESFSSNVKSEED